MRWCRRASNGIRGALAAVLILPTPVLASALDATTPAEYLATMDLDGDGRVSLSEYQSQLMRGAEWMDRNHDGLLSADELPPGTRTRHGRPVSLARQREAFAARFRLQDRNGDHYLDAAELGAPPQ